MVSWLPHVYVPMMFALAFLRRFPRAWVIALAPVVWLPDLDYIGGVHRVFTHNLWIPLVFLAAAWLWWRRSRPAEKFSAAVMTPGWGAGLVLTSYYWASHVFLDIFAGGVLMFWPLSNTNFYAFYEIHANLRTGEVTPIEEHGTSEGVPPLDPDYTWLSFEHSATLAFLAVCGLVAVGWWGYKRYAIGRAKP